MQKAIVIGLLTGLGAFAGAMVTVPALKAADEVRCRVNAEALVRDLAALNSTEINRLLVPKPAQSDRDALQDAINKNPGAKAP